MILSRQSAAFRMHVSKVNLPPEQQRRNLANGRYCPGFTEDSKKKSPFARISVTELVKSG